MVTQNKDYFKTLFVPTYNVTAENMDDLVDSAFFQSQNIAIAANGALYYAWQPDNAVLDWHNLNLINVSDYLTSNYAVISVANNNLVKLHLDGPLSNITHLDASVNAIVVGEIKNVLQPIAATGNAVIVDLSGGTNAAHYTWDADSLAAEATILANGGTVNSNP
jgi:hypothetical protein